MFLCTRIVGLFKIDVSFCKELKMKQKIMAKGVVEYSGLV